MSKEFPKHQPAKAPPIQAPENDRHLIPGQTALRSVNRWDWIIVVFFLAVAGLFLLGRLQGNYPNVILSGDAGNVASYAAALDHPGWFNADPGLNSIDIIGIDNVVTIPLVRALTRLTGNYGLASVLLIFPDSFLQLLGFYLLGRVLLKNRFWAFLMAVLIAMTVLHDQIGMGEIWGVWPDSLPRVTFQSLLPFLLVLVFAWKDHPGRWPWLMVFSGLLVYVHPVSAPTWGFTIWLSLWLLLPEDWGWWRRLGVMLGLGVLFLVAITPYAINYFTHQMGGKAIDYNTIMAILQQNAPLNIFGALGDFLLKSSLDLLLPLALVGFVATWLLKKSDRLPVSIVLAWMAGIFIICVLVPSVEKIITQQLHIPPLETELVRGIRYFIPLFLIFWLWPLAEWTRRRVSPQVRWMVLVLGILLVCFWALTNRTALSYMHAALTCFTHARLVCSPPQTVDELIQALHSQSNPGDGVFFFDQTSYHFPESVIRYVDLRPLVYSEQPDINNRSSLTTWLAITQRLDVIRAMPDPVERLQSLIPLAKGLNAKYLVVDSRVLPDQLDGLPVKALLENNDYSLLQIR